MDNSSKAKSHLPFSDDAEKALLGCMVLESHENVDLVRNQITSEAFYVPANRIIFETFLALYDAGKPLDFTLVVQDLEKRGQLDEVGGKQGLNDVWTFVPSGAVVNYYTEIVLKKYQRRQVILSAQKAIELAQDDNADFDLVRDQIEQVLTGLACDGHKEKSTKEITLDWFDELAGRHERLKREGFAFGIPSVDKQLGPMRPGDYVIITADTSGGKSALAFQGALHAARCGLPVAAFSLEMRDEQLWDRMFSHLAQVSMNSFRDGLFKKEEIDRLNAEMPRFCELPFYPGQTRGNDINQLASKLRKLKRRNGIKVAVVDYLQRVSASTKHRDGSRYLEVAEVSDKLKSLALELELVMIAPVQLNKDGGTREAASIEHDCDVHLKLTQDEDDSGNVDLWVEKNRQGRRHFIIPLRLDGEFMTLSERERSPKNNGNPRRARGVPCPD